MIQDTDSMTDQSQTFTKVNENSFKIAEIVTFVKHLFARVKCLDLFKQFSNHDHQNQHLDIKTGTPK